MNLLLARLRDPGYVSLDLACLLIATFRLLLQRLEHYIVKLRIHLSLSDIAVGCALGWLEFRYPELAWRTEYPNLGKLMDKLMQRPSFADTKPAV